METDSPAAVAHVEELHPPRAADRKPSRRHGDVPSRSLFKLFNRTRPTPVSPVSAVAASAPAPPRVGRAPAPARCPRRRRRRLRDAFGGRLRRARARVRSSSFLPWLDDARVARVARCAGARARARLHARRRRCCSAPCGSSRHRRHAWRRKALVVARSLSRLVRLEPEATRHDLAAGYAPAKGSHLVGVARCSSARAAAPLAVALRRPPAMVARRLACRTRALGEPPLRRAVSLRRQARAGDDGPTARPPPPGAERARRSVSTASRSQQRVDARRRDGLVAADGGDGADQARRVRRETLIRRYGASDRARRSSRRSAARLRPRPR